MQRVLLPSYDPVVGMSGLDACPPGQASRLWLIVNPNSGPGLAVDRKVSKLVRRARDAGATLLYYLDLVAHPGDGLVPASAEKKPKSKHEIMDERNNYVRMYGSPDGWFLDDVVKGADVTVVSNLKGYKVLNPGCAYTPPVLVDAVVVAEKAGAWPRALTEWETKNKNKCAVMGLKVKDVSQFKASTEGLGFVYASPLDDDWQKGKTAYTKLPPYFSKLF